MTETIDPKPRKPLMIKKPDGAYYLGTKDFRYLEISVRKKPRLIHRLFTRLLLGWRWIDYPRHAKKDKPSTRPCCGFGWEDLRKTYEE